MGAIGLGLMPLSIARRPDEASAVKVVQVALDAGMTLLDTADVYCLNHTDIGHNERLLKKALDGWKGDRASLVVATKGGLERPDGDWTRNGRPEHLRAACEASLKALGQEVIDLYQLHAPDPEVPFAESVGALAELRAAGKIRHIGLSNVSVAEIEQARAVVEIVSVQNRCNLFERMSFQSGVVRYCADHGIAFLPHSPVGGHWGHKRLGEASALMAIASAHRATVYEVALAWLLQISPAMIPIPGASRPQSALSSARAAQLHLTEAEMHWLNTDPSAPAPA